MKFFPRPNLLTLIIGIGFSISACGQKGPLFLPAKPPAVSTPYPVAISNKGANKNANESAPASYPDQN